MGNIPATIPFIGKENLLFFIKNEKKLNAMAYHPGMQQKYNLFNNAKIFFFSDSQLAKFKSVTPTKMHQDSYQVQYSLYVRREFDLE